MSYIFSRALVEAYLEASCSDSAPFALSNLNPIPQAYCSLGRMTAYSRLSRFGMTCAPLTDDRGAALLTWYLEASRARTFPQQEKAPALTAPDPASGGKCTELSMRYDRNSHSWKTHLCLWDEDLPESSVILPKSGTMRNGLVLGADDVGAPHVRKRIWILAHDPHANGLQRPQQGEPFTGTQEPDGCSDNRLDAEDDVANSDNERSRRRVEFPACRPEPWNVANAPCGEVQRGKPGVMAGPICSRKSLNSAAGAGREIPKPPCLGLQETWPEKQSAGITRICPDVSDSNRQLRRQGNQPGNQGRN